jgi:hypothetical protein
LERDHSILSPAAIFDYCIQQRKGYEEPKQGYQYIELILLSFTAQTLKEMETSGQEPIPSMSDYTKWLRARVDSYLNSDDHESNLMGYSDRHALINCPETLRKLTKSVESHSSQEIVNATAGHNLKGILLGRVDPLQLRFEDNCFLFEFYEELSTAGKAFDMLNSYINLLVHKDSGLKFLETGAGTGETTTGMLSILNRPDCGTRNSTYTFTNISASFFPDTQQ